MLGGNICRHRGCDPRHASAFPCGATRPIRRTKIGASSTAAMPKETGGGCQLGKSIHKAPAQISSCRTPHEDRLCLVSMRASDSHKGRHRGKQLTGEPPSRTCLTSCSTLTFADAGPDAKISSNSFIWPSYSSQIAACSTLTGPRKDNAKTRAEKRQNDGARGGLCDPWAAATKNSPNPAHREDYQATTHNTDRRKRKTHDRHVGKVLTATATSTFEHKKIRVKTTTCERQPCPQKKKLVTDQ